MCLRVTNWILFDASARANSYQCALDAPFLKGGEIVRRGGENKTD